MGFRTIQLEIHPETAILTLNRPPLNILNLDMMGEMAEALEEVSRNEEIKVLLVRAEGKAFSAGVEVEDHLGERVGPMIDLFHRVIRLLYTTPCPTVAAIQGAALGGGLEVALACDIALAVEGAKLGQPEIKLGVFPPVAAVLMPRLVGPQRAAELLLTGDLIPATEAVRMGLIARALPPDTFARAVEELCSKLKGLSPLVLRLTKKAWRLGSVGGFPNALTEVEALYLDQLMKTEDANEGLRAFLEKRPPAWRNR